MSRKDVAGRLSWQAGWCRKLGSPLYGHLLERGAEDVAAGGPLARVLEPHAGDPNESMLQLRLMGAVHRLVLEGAAPQLAPFYASATPEPDPGDAWPAFLATAEHHADRLAELVLRPVQTNEVGRCAALLAGFLLAARAGGHPLRLLELGASAGLNLRWDRYRYALGDRQWGPEESPVQIAAEADGEPPPVVPAPEVAERRGCDLSPIDPRAEEGRLTVLSYCWPDQTRRLELLRGALEVAKDVDAPVDQAPAGEWLAARLADPAPGATTVVFHSIVMQYVPEEERQRILARLAEAGDRAGDDAPLAWLRMEPAGEYAEVRLTTWPGGEERLVAEAGYHGSPLRLAPALR